MKEQLKAFALRVQRLAEDNPLEIAAITAVSLLIGAVLA